MPHRSIVTRSRKRRAMTASRCTTQWHPIGGVPPILPYRSSNLFHHRPLAD
jgi:hypothetical protein